MGTGPYTARNCKRQETCARNLCQCKLVWHQCLEHRVDPPTHSSRKGRKGVRLSKAAMKVEKEVCRSSGRKAPRTDIYKKAVRTSAVSRPKVDKHSVRITSHAKPVDVRYPPSEAILLRIRSRTAQSQEDQEARRTRRKMEGLTSNMGEAQSSSGPPASARSRNHKT